MDFAIRHESHQAARDSIINVAQVDFQGSLTIGYGRFIDTTNQAANVELIRNSRNRVLWNNLAAHHKGTVDAALVSIAEQTVVATLVATITNTYVLNVEVGYGVTLAIIVASKRQAFRRTRDGVAYRHPDVLQQINVTSLLDVHILEVSGFLTVHT